MRQWDSPRALESDIYSRLKEIQIQFAEKRK